MISEHRNNSQRFAPDRVLPGGELLVFIEKLMQKYPVMGPRERSDQPGFYRFDWLETPRDFIPDYTTTTIPPKKAFFPPHETLFRFELESTPKLAMVQEDFPFVLAGVHPCDLAALAALDTAYLYPPLEVRWRENRKRGIIIGIDCRPDEYCFCTSLGTCDERSSCDLFFTKIDNDYLVEILTRKGEKLLIGLQTRRAREKHLQQAERRLRQKKDAISIRFNDTFVRLAGILDKGGLMDVWKETARRCFSCGSCNTTCPTCFCFNMHDEFDLTLKSGRRYRTWDSCQLLEFALIAGGENMRAERWQRVRHRWHRKFLYLYRKFGVPFCTGCGRCSRACTADIHIVDVTNRIIEVAKQEALSE